VVTFEFENVPDATAELLSGNTRVFPPASALRVSQDRLIEKRYFQELGIATARFMAVEDDESLHEAVAKLGLPSILKTRRFGYDGKGQCLLQTAEDLSHALEQVSHRPCILEQFVTYDRELSLVAVRAADGSSLSYPLLENVHRSGILHRSTAPASVPPQVAQAATQSVERLLDRLDYVGVLTVEFFDVGGKLLANEFAPRVHNSGHLTIEAATTSQFENHLRAICGLPLGSTELLCHATMLNLVGSLPAKAAVLRTPGAHYHDYAKQSRPGRKVGHVTVTAKDADELSDRLRAVEAVLQ
jgi:5-(carboxyamino)imidazole ribonucleotide synthase